MNRVVRERELASGQLIQLVQGDITTETVDAIVNAANSHLQHGGGVAAAIVRRGGHQIQAESDEWVRRHGPVSHDSPAYTGAGSLPCRYVIHAVGPVWRPGAEQEADQALRAAVTGSLRVAEELNLTSIALPAISTGIFGFPKERAARLILSAMEAYFQEHPEGSLKQVRVTLFDQPTLQAFLDVWTDIQPTA